MKTIQKLFLLVLMTFSLTALLPTTQLVYATDAAAPPANPSELNFEGECNVGPGEQLTSANCGIVAYIVLGINILSAVAGMVIVGSIMIAGYQYMTARDDPGAIKAARERIVWALSALLLFIFMYAFLNFIVPGGVL